jgi:hypothetical protein
LSFFLAMVTAVIIAKAMLMSTTSPSCCNVHSLYLWRALNLQATQRSSLWMQHCCGRGFKIMEVENNGGEIKREGLVDKHVTCSLACQTNSLRRNHYSSQVPTVLHKYALCGTFFCFHIIYLPK